MPTTLGDTFEALVVVMGTLQIRAWRSLADLGTSFSNLELIHGALIINEMGGLRTLGIAFSKLVGVGFDRGPSDYEAESRSQYAQYGLGLVISECENLRSFGTAFSMLKYIHDGLHLANNRHLADPIGNSGPAFRQLVSGAGLYYYHLMGLPPHTHTHHHHHHRRKPKARKARDLARIGFIQKEGKGVYVPSQWGHAELNLNLEPLVGVSGQKWSAEFSSPPRGVCGWGGWGKPVCCACRPPRPSLMLLPLCDLLG